MTTADHSPHAPIPPALIARLRAEYAEDPNVISIGHGLPRRNNRSVSENALVFWVRRKPATARGVEALGSRPIPAEIEGFRTDVQVAAAQPSASMMGERNKRIFDPLRGGIGSSNASNHIAWFNGMGTLGVLARDAEDRSVALSNWHVWADGGEEGDIIIQPGNPPGSSHGEAVGTIAACGPLLGSLLGWSMPSPLTLGLYAGAAAAAVAAAASDVRDPTRRGQDATVPAEDERTLREQVDLAIEYPEMPLPGRAFATDVSWRYARQTDTRVLTHEVQEIRRNTQFLLGSEAWVDAPSYRPGSRVRIGAALWDHWKRSCGDYHVVAHLVPEDGSRTVVRQVLAPVPCPPKLPWRPPDSGEDQEVCVGFEDLSPGPIPPRGAFGWLRYAHPGDQLTVVDWVPEDHGILVSSPSLALAHAPAGAVRLSLVTLAGPVTVLAVDAAGQQVASALTPRGRGPHTLRLAGDGIRGVLLRGGEESAALLRYCVEGIGQAEVRLTASEQLAADLTWEGREAPAGERSLTATRCCFAGITRLPWDAPRARWGVHLTVQNVNTVPQGTPPEEAAKTIGGHLLSSHADPQLLGCLAVVAADEYFDVI